MNYYRIDSMEKLNISHEAHSDQPYSKAMYRLEFLMISMIGQRRDSVGLLSRYGQRSLWMEVNQWYMNMGDWLEGGSVCENCGQVLSNMLFLVIS